MSSVFNYLIVDQFLAHDLKLDKFRNILEIPERYKGLRATLLVNEPDKLELGDVLYSIKPDGSLEIIRNNYDTSD